ncbi:hypothetical protein C8Q79DRAFT_1010550 [Trametes meyenii]|nr:hypothetical protein C8Q79DRAFT_1010550 [Trametes meyenii]
MASSPPPSTPPEKRPLPMEELLTATGRRKAKKARVAEDSPFIHYGRHFIRTVDMITLPSVILTEGLLRDPGANSNTFSALENRRYTAFKSVVKMVPAVSIKLDDPSTTAEEVQQWLESFGAALQLGGSGAKSDDTRSLKGAVVDWLQASLMKASPPIHLVRDGKAGRGFHNDVTGRLICPAVLDWEDESVRIGLLRRTAKIDGALINGSHWPNFLYAGKFNALLPWVGFLQGKYLVQAYRHIFTSPSSARGDVSDASDTDDVSHIRGDTAASSSVRATRAGNAANHGMTAVNAPSIAYTAAQLFFALSDSSTFIKTQKGCDAFGLYNAILDYFEEPDFKAINDELLMWWNRQVFPAEHVEKNTANHGLAHMREAMRAYSAACAAEAAASDASIAAESIPGVPAGSSNA